MSHHQLVIRALRHLELTRSSLFRACVVLLVCLMMVAGTAACPTGDSLCDMPEMASADEVQETCLLACGIPLPVETTVSPEFFGTVASVSAPTHSTGIGLIPEPHDRPPRFLG
jgi:hypothetical protein